jgi:SAM-dependent methyltransferase
MERAMADAAANPNATPNAAQADYWNAQAGPTWVEFQDQLDRQLDPLGQKAMEALAPQAGEQIADIGCGCGHSSLQLAQRIGGSGAVTGLDISATMLAVARRRAEAAGANAHFIEADVQTADIGAGAFDAVFSRFGVMFFIDPAAAFANIRRALKPGGRLAFVCWRPFAQNTWMLAPFEAAQSFLKPSPPADPLAPGPYAFADPQRVRGILETTGFSQIAIDPFDVSIGGGSVDETVGLNMRVGPLGSALKENPGVAEDVAEAVRAAVTPYLTPQGVLMPAAVWIVQARA